MFAIAVIVAALTVLAVSSWILWKRARRLPTEPVQQAQQDAVALAMVQMMAQMIEAHGRQVEAEKAMPPRTVLEARAARSAALWGFRPSK